jgi:hypothetical protein
MLTQMLSKWLIVLDYELNREYIAKNLCENRSQPKLQCKGKCQLAKKLAAEEKEDPATPRNGGTIKSAEVLYDDNISCQSTLGIMAAPVLHYTPYFIKRYTPPVFSVFHPPAVS